MAETDPYTTFPTSKLTTEEPSTTTPAPLGYVRSKDTFLPNLGASLSTDIAAATMLLPGLIGSGLETIYEKATSEKDKPWGETWKETTKKGVDSWLLQKGYETRKKLREDLFDLPVYSRTTSGQLGELAGLAAPIPAKWLSALGNVGSKAAFIATPAVAIKGGKKAFSRPYLPGNIGRMGAQYGVGSAIDQGLRYLVDEPLVASDIATGAVEDDPYAMFPSSSVRLQDGNLNDISVTTGSVSNPYDNISSSIDTERQEADRIIREENDSSTFWNWFAGAAGLAGVYAGIRRRKKLRNLEQAVESPFGVSESERSPGSMAGRIFDERAHLKKVALNAEDAKGRKIFTEDEAATTIEEFGTDSHGQASRAIVSGDLCEVGKEGKRLETESLQEIAYLARSIQEDIPEGSKFTWQDLLGSYFRGVAADSTHAVNIRGTLSDTVHKMTKSTELASDKALQKELVRLIDVLENGSLDQMRVELGKLGIKKLNSRGLINPATGKQYTHKQLQKLRDNKRKIESSYPKLAEVSRRLEKISNDMMEYMVQKGVLDTETAGLIKGRHIYTEGKGKDKVSRNLFSPRIEAHKKIDIFKGLTRENFLERIHSMFRGSEIAREAQSLSAISSSLAQKGGGVQTPMNAIEGMQHYIYSVIDYTNRQIAPYRFLTRLLGINSAGKPISGKKFLENKYGISFLGINDPNKPMTYKQIIKQYNDGDQNIKSLYNVEDPVTFKSVENNPGLVSLQIRGKEWLFHVPEKVIRDVLTGTPRQLNWFNKLGRAAKNLLQFNTTKLPMFLPTSWAYSTGSLWQNRMAKEGVYEFSPRDAFKATWRLTWDTIADEMSAHILAGLATNTGLFSKIPRNTAEAMQRRLAKAVRNSVYHGIELNTGQLSSSMFAKENVPKTVDILKQVAPHWQKESISGLSQAFRYYDRIVRALAEGPGYAATLKHLGDDPSWKIPSALKDPPLPSDPKYYSRKQLREGSFAGKDIIGDVRRKGSGAEFFNSWVPWSGAMLQAWYSMGGAIYHGLKRGHTVPVMAAISVPAIPAFAEAIHISLLGEEYRKWYWNLSVTQRNNNMIMALPGVPPERSALIPISPEWSLIKGFGIEFADALFYLSSGGTLGSQKWDNGSHLLAGVARVLNIPMNPHWQATFAATGNRLSVGPEWRDGDILPSLYSIRPFGRGENISGNRGRSRFIDPALEKEIDGVMTSYLGGAAQLMMSIWHNMRVGSKGDEPISGAIEGAWYGFKTEVARQARYSNPAVPGGILRVSPYDQVSDKVISKKEGLKVLLDSISAAKSPQTVSSTNLRELPTPKPLTTDPIMLKAMEVYESNDLYKSSIKKYNDEIAGSRAVIDNLRNHHAIVNTDGQHIPIPPKQLHNIIDSESLKMKGLYNLQLEVLNTLEDDISEAASKQLGRDVDFTFEDLANETIPRRSPGRGGPFSSIYLAPRIPPRTSQ